jgi:hypothetical protein
LFEAKLPEPARLALTEVLRTGRLERKNGELGLNGNGVAANGGPREVRHG